VREERDAYAELQAEFGQQMQTAAFTEDTLRSERDSAVAQASQHHTHIVHTSSFVVQHKYNTSSATVLLMRHAQWTDERALRASALQQSYVCCSCKRCAP
jgi:hypothetical protein